MGAEMGGTRETVTSKVRDLASHMPASVKRRVPYRPATIPHPAPRDSANFKFLQSLMKTYRVENLVNMDRKQFKEGFERFLSLDDSEMEGLNSPEGQRVRTVRFMWPFDHDFGDFKVGPGTGASRPMDLIGNFMDQFDVPSRDLKGKRVLDIGCYAGGTSLLLAAMGAEVVAVEEVAKYVESLKFLRDAFGLENLEPRNLSLYDLTTDEFQDAFDIVLFAGVLYHISDVILGMRITYNALKPGGTTLLETASTRSEERILEYAGKNQKGANKYGANWFFPSPLVVTELMDEVGYKNIESFVRRNPQKIRDRTYAMAKKEQQEDFLRAGFAVRDIR
jgi:2-polyprenyl-3-methyl-5-hydroxy-6-metoxy-1,4-benzoquinol methylase